MSTNSDTMLSLSAVPVTVAALPTQTFVLVIFSVVGAVILLLDIVLLLLTMKTQKQRMIRNSFTSMDHSAVQGSLMLVVSVVMMGLHSGIVSERILNISCYSTFVLLMTGITYCMGALLMKSSAVYYHFQSKPKPIQNWMPCLGIVMLLIIDAALCIARALTNPFRLEDSGSMGTCTTDNNMYWTIGFLVYKGFILLFAVLMGVAALYLTKHIRTDLKHVTIASLINVLLFIAGVVMMFGVNMTPIVTYIVHGSFILFGCLQTLIALILAKVKSNRIDKQSRGTDTDVDTGHVYHNPSAEGSERSLASPGGQSDSYHSSGNYENASP